MQAVFIGIKCFSSRPLIVCSIKRCSHVINPKKIVKLSRGISIAEASKNGNGEDALFIQERDIGVFDGVGGWKNSGVDPGIYSRQLSDGVSDFVATARAEQQQGSLRGSVDLAKAIDYGAELCKTLQLTGSSTACIASLDEKERQLRCLNIGDSSLVLFRRGLSGRVEVVEKAEVTLHGFNFPSQIGNDPRQANMRWDSSASAKQGVFPLRAGDVAVTASDGIWDNLFDEDVCSVLEKSGIWHGAGEKSGPISEGDVDDVVHDLLSLALKNSASKVAKTPWSVAVMEHYKRKYAGGKPDDMTVIVSYFHDSV